MAQLPLPTLPVIKCVLETVLSIIAAALGLFLSYYLTSAGSFTAMEPVYMLAFLLVWLLPTLLLSGLVKYF